MKKIIFIMAIIFLLFFLFSKDYIDYKRTGVNYFINNEDYIYSQIYYTESFSFSLDNIDEGFTFDDKYMFQIIDYEQEDDTLFMNFVIKNNDNKYGIGEILYLYSFETSNRDYSIYLTYNGVLYQGKLQNEGPFNNDGFRFTIKFEDIQDIVSDSSTITVDFNNFIITTYERR